MGAFSGTDCVSYKILLGIIRKELLVGILYWSELVTYAAEELGFDTYLANQPFMLMIYITTNFWFLSLFKTPSSVIYYKIDQ